MKSLYIKKNSVILMILLTLTLLFTTSCDSATGNNNEDGEKGNNQNDINEKAFEGLSDNDILKLAVENLNKKENYFIEANGKTTAKAIITYTQTTKTLKYYMNGTFYNKIDSTSALVDHHHEIFLKDDNVKYYDSGEKEVYENDVKLYQEKYGVVPNNIDIFNYQFQEDTILSSERNFQNAKYEITYVLDPEKIGDALGKQMKVFGDLVDQPLFNYISLSISIDKDGNILSFKNVEKYKIVKSVLGINSTMNCTQEMISIVTYDNYDIPSKGEYIDFNMTIK